MIPWSGACFWTKPSIFSEMSKMMTMMMIRASDARKVRRNFRIR